MFFLIHINNLPYTTAEPSKCVLLADDTSLIITNNNYKIKGNINNIIGNIDDWFRGNTFSLNFDKTYFSKFQNKIVMKVI